MYFVLGVNKCPHNRVNVALSIMHMIRVISKRSTLLACARPSQQVGGHKNSVISAKADNMANLTDYPPREAIYEEKPKDNKKTKKAVSETVYGFAEAFTGHGIHYIFERDQLVICRLFWIAIVIVAGVLAILW